MERTAKYITLLLRHQPEKEGLVMDEKGWVSIKDLTSALSITFDDLIKIVESDDKKRFEIDSTKTKIRACQGHSLGIQLGLESIEPPEFLYHGTSSDKKMSIKSTGLVKMSRDYVHLSDDIETATKVGKRHGFPIILKIDTKQMFLDGSKFYKSTNGVWLTDKVEPRYIKII